MADPIVLRTGASFQTDGAVAQARGGKTGEMVMASAHGKYAEATTRGNCYSASVGAAGVAPGTALGTTAAFTLYNPKGSGKRLIVNKCSIAFISGTLGAGALFYCANNDGTAAAPSSGTALTPTNNDIGAANNSVAVPRAGGTLPVNPTILRPFASVDAETTSSVYGVRPAVEDLDGEFVLEPGCALSVEGVAAAGTTPLVSIGMSWEEVQVG